MPEQAGDATVWRALFPLGTVLFPGGRLPLRIFEARYVDMVSTCMRESTPFGVVPIKSGSEVGKGAEFYATGTLATIESFDQSPDGLLLIETRGTRRFSVRHHEVGRDGLFSGELELLDDDIAPVPQSYIQLRDLLEQLYARQPELAVAEPWHFEQASWVAWRLAELMPIPVATRVDLLRQSHGADMLARLADFFQP